MDFVALFFPCRVLSQWVFSIRFLPRPRYIVWILFGCSFTLLGYDYLDLVLLLNVILMHTHQCIRIKDYFCFSFLLILHAIQHKNNVFPIRFNMFVLNTRVMLCKIRRDETYDRGSYTSFVDLYDCIEKH